MCPTAHLWFFSAATLPRLLQACGFAVKEVRTLRGDGNNLYQYALMAAGSRLNDLRLRLHPRREGIGQRATRGDSERAMSSARHRATEAKYRRPHGSERRPRRSRPPVGWRHGCGC
jgi:hypothetical protein